MTGKRVGVAFLMNSLRFGGAEKHTLQLFNSLDDSQFRLGLVYLKREEHLLAQVEPNRLNQVWCADFGRGWDTRGLFRLKCWLKSFEPDVLVCVNTYPLFYGHLACSLAGTRAKLFEIFHSTELPPNEDRKMRLLYRHLFNISDQIVYVSEAQRLYWEGRGIRDDRGGCIPNGIDTEYFRDGYTLEEKKAVRDKFGFTEDDFLVGICAALRPEKHHADLLDAIARLKREGIPAKCLIIGDGPCRSEIEVNIVELGLAQDAVITGFQEDVRPFIAACDCMAIVSHLVETFSLAALESMALGKPMIMSEVGGAAEQIVNGEHGYLFPAGDIEQLTNVLRALSRPGVCRRLGVAARSRVEEHFQCTHMVQRYANLFNAAAANE